MPPQGPGRGHPFARLTIAFCVVYVAALAFSVWTTVRHFDARKVVGITARLDGSTWLVSAVDPRGPAAGAIRPGDVIRSVNGDTRAQLVGLAPIHNLAVGARYRLGIEREGAATDIDLVVGSASPYRGWLIFFVISITFVATGASLALVRPEDSRVRLFSATIMLVGIGTLTDVQTDARSLLDGWESLVYVALTAMNGWQFPLAFHFTSQFPEGRSPGRAWTVLQWTLYALAMIVWAAMLNGQLLLIVGGERVFDFAARHPTVHFLLAHVRQDYLQGYLVLCLILTVAATIWNYRRLRDPGSRRRIRWFVTGLIAGVLPWILLVGGVVGGVIGPAAYRTFYPIVCLAFLALPICTAVAVWKDQLFEVRVIVRRGIQYLLAKGALRALLALPPLALALSIAANPDRTVAQLLSGGWGAFNLVAMVAIGGSLRYRDRLRTGIDRRFFREAYREEQVLLQLIDEIRAEKARAGITRLVSARLDSVLHPATILVCYRDELDAGRRADGQDIPDARGIVRLMEGIRAPLDFPFTLDVAIGQAARAWLAQAGVQLIVPMVGPQDDLAGLILLGEKLSDEPYSETDRSLLQRIGAEMATGDRRRTETEPAAPLVAAMETVVLDTPEGGQAPVLGQTIDRKYRLERELGRGGMGVVYEALDVRLDRKVAVKVLTQRLSGDEDARRRFEREARAAARLEHPNVMRLYDYGMSDRGLAYIVMERLVGRTWRAELDRERRVPAARAADWFAQLLFGLEAAHRSGIVHRDLKPENVMMTVGPGGEEVLKIMDFGLAKSHAFGDEAGRTETQTELGKAAGTVGYMAPEALLGGPADPRVDIFAVGVMLVETLTGERPFPGKTLAEVILAVAIGTYHLPAEFGGGGPLDAVIERALAKQPADRYATAREMATALIPAMKR